jgi:hypothetical protein
MLPVRDGAPSRTGPPARGGAVQGGAGHARASRGRARRWPAVLVGIAVLAAALAIALPLLLRSGSPGMAAGHRTVAAAGNGTLAAIPDRSADRNRPNPTASKHSPSPQPAPSHTLPADSTAPQLVHVPDVIGDTVKRATQVLEDAGFEVKVVTGPFPVNVSDYSPTGEVAAGSTITIDVVDGF